MALFTGERAPANPWDSRSYEWLTPSPPPPHNFTRSPRSTGPVRLLGAPAGGHAAVSEKPADQFEDLARQAHAARLGMWVFLSSEVLFFAGLFALYATYRIEHPAGFGEGVLHNTLALGSTNTAVFS